jgi:hypothetical protein
MIQDPDQFPLHALPQSVFGAVCEAHELTRAPIPMIVSSALSAMAFSVQAKANVVRFNDAISPIHLNTLVIAESGERKTSVDNLYFAQLGPWFDSLQEAYKARLAKFEVEFNLWKSKQKGLLLAHKKLAQEGIDLPTFNAEVKAHHANMPQAPHAPRFYYRDVTIEALLSGLQAWPSAAISANEAGMLFNGRTFNSLETFNTLWDGGTASLHRKNAEPVQVSGAKLTVSLMAQPEVMKNFLLNKGSAARGNGFLARCLICFPTSSQGTRFEQTTFRPLTPQLDAFRERMRDLLCSTIDDEGRLISKPELLNFHWAAQTGCLEFANWIEGQLGFNGFYADIKDAASKIGENMARLAAILHCFTGQTGPIEIGTVNQAAAIASWYLNQFKLLFGNRMTLSQEEMDIQILADWLRCRARQTGINEVPKSILERYGPNHLRSKPALDPVLFNLEARRWIVISKRNKAHIVQMTPALFPPEPSMASINYAI